jgi:hypothetical protein
MASVLKWWRDFVGGWRGFRASLGFASRFGRIYGLRDRGAVEEALNLALALAADIKASPRSWNPTDRIMAAAIVDALAQRLDRREVAYDALKHALDVIDEEKTRLVSSLRPKPGDFASLLGRHERHFRESVNLIVSRRNG